MQIIKDIFRYFIDSEVIKTIIDASLHIIEVPLFLIIAIVYIYFMFEYKRNHRGKK